MIRKLRPQPLSAFSTDTTIRSTSRSSTYDSTDSISSTTEQEDSIQHDWQVNQDESLNRIGSSFALLLSNTRSTEETDDDDDENHLHHPRLSLRASSNASTTFEDSVISPLTLDNPIEPPSPLSPFGNLALFDALSPLPTPRFDVEDAEEVGVSALAMEKFESEEGFPWFEYEEDVSQVSEGEMGRDGQGRFRCASKGQSNLDTPPPSNPSSPSSSNDSGRPSISTTLHPSTSLPSPPLTNPTPSRPPRPSRDSSSFDSWNPFPSSSPPPIPSPFFLSSFPPPPQRTKNRLRRSTHTLTSLFANRSKPLLNRGRSASLPTTSLTSTSTPSSSSSGKGKRCKSIKRSLSLSRSKKSTRPPSQIQKSTISSPVPVHCPLTTISPPPRKAFDVSRSTPTSPLSQYRFCSTTSISPESIRTIDPLFSSIYDSSPTLGHCRICASIQDRLKKEEEKSRALELELERLKKVVKILVHSETP